MSRIEIATSRTALLLLDLQNYNVHPDGYWASVTPGLVERVAPSLERTVEVLAAARAARIAVVRVKNAWRDGHPDINPHTPWQVEAKTAGRSTEGSWGVDFFAPVAPVDGEFVVRKRAVSAFVGTSSNAFFAFVTSRRLPWRGASRTSRSKEPRATPLITGTA